MKTEKIIEIAEDIIEIGEKIKELAKQESYIDFNFNYNFRSKQLNLYAEIINKADKIYKVEITEK